MVTIHDVARLASVSPATVSRVLSGKTVNATLTEQVRVAAEQLGYRPNRRAQSLRSKRSKLVGLIIPDIENPFFTAIARGVEDALEPEGYSVVLCNSDSDTAKETRYIGVAVSEAMAGVVIAPASAGTDLEPLLDRNSAVVVIDRDPLTVATDVVVLADRESSSELVGELLSRGYERIACITGPGDVETSIRRSEGWRDAHREQGRPVPEELLIFSDYRFSGGREAMNRLYAASTPPDAIFIANNLMAVGAIEAMREHATERALAVFGALPRGAERPRECLIADAPGRELGRVAARRLLERFADASTPVHRDVLPVPLLG
ncbi:LacI family DNA-binding transcriptional regulator [uncultured Agrococcus sp.]|uniref:LacI family DNA-binding transcriptional regulator n=1 Tax=uncultured Agrococcus sp. TaxID=382258 RepID=UPI0025DE3EAD|nr:LacI family DNA-binding transcriptional regulator [uncultured Agrococcus sp.]